MRPIDADKLLKKERLSYSYLNDEFYVRKSDIENAPTIEEWKKEWHKYPEEQPNKEGRYLVCHPLGMIPPAPFIFIAYWGKSGECERSDKSLKRKKAYWYNIDDELGDYALNYVYAWMPLPEPMPLPNERKERKETKDD